MRNQKSINLLNHFHDGLSAPDTESNRDRLLQVLRRLKEKCLQVRQVEEKKSSSHGERGRCWGDHRFLFHFILDLFLFLFQQDPEPLPSPPQSRSPAESSATRAQPRPAAGSSGAPHRERGKEKKTCVWKRARERERHLMTGKVFREGFATQRHNREKQSAKVSKTQSRRISTGLDFLCSELAGGQTSANDGSYSQTPNNQPVTIKSRHTGHDRLWRSLDTDRMRGKNCMFNHSTSKCF